MGFSQSDIGFMNASRYGNAPLNNNQNNNTMQQQLSEEQRAMNRQRELHKTMDAIKRRWFPNSYKKEKQKQYNEQKEIRSGLKRIPDAISNEQKADKNKAIITKIRRTLSSEMNFEQFQNISVAYKNDKLSSTIFFREFKSLFAPLCTEDVWSNILITMLALLPDAQKRRKLYEEYRGWVLGGRIDRRTAIKNNKRRQQQQPAKSKANAKRTTVPSAASIVSGAYKKPSKEMIMSQRRAQKSQQKKRIKNKKKQIQQQKQQMKQMKPIKSAPPNVKAPSIATKGMWKTGAP